MSREEQGVLASTVERVWSDWMTSRGADISRPTAEEQDFLLFLTTITLGPEYAFGKSWWNVLSAMTQERLDSLRTLPAYGGGASTASKE